MATINDFDAKAFLPMLRDHISELPNMRFRSDVVDITSSLNGIGDAISLKIPAMSGGETEKMILEQTIAAYDSLKSCPQHREYFNKLNSLASSLGESLVTVFQTLRSSVRPEVESLMEATSAKTSELLEKNENIVELNGQLTAAQPTPNFINVNWDMELNKAGGENVIADAYRDMTSYEPSKNFTDVQVGLDAMRPAVTQMNIDEETKEDMQQRLEDGATGEDQAGIEAIFKMATDPYAFSEFIHSQLNMSTAPAFGATLRNNLSALNTIYPALKKVQSTPLNISEDMQNEWTANLSAIDKVMWLINYQLVCFRKYYNGALIIDETTVNGDMYGEFMNQGGSDQLIANYLAANFAMPNIPVPNSGVATEAVLQGKDNADQQVNEKRAAVNLSLVTLKASATNAALKEVLVQHLKATDPSRLPDNVGLEEFVEMKMPLVESTVNGMDSSNGSYLEHTLYNFVLQLWYDGTMVQTAHELFGAEMVKQLTLKQDLSEAELNVVDATVASTIVSKFLMNNLCTFK